MGKKNTPPVRVCMHRVMARIGSDLGFDKSLVGYLHRRLSAEGQKFLTVTLPRLAKIILSSLETGKFVREDSKGLFTCWRWKGALLGNGLFQSLAALFDSRTGVVRPDADPVDLWRIRQLCEYFYKLSLPFTSVQRKDALKKYLQVEETLGAAAPDPCWLNQLRKDFETYYPEISNASIDQVLSKERPRSGSGAWAGSNLLKLPFYKARELPTGQIPRKFEAIAGSFKHYPSSPEVLKIEPGSDHGNGFMDVSRTRSGKRFPKAPQGPTEKDYAEVLFVPKDSRGPRTISKEPWFWLQVSLAFFDWITSSLEGKGSTIRFTDQGFNQDLARRSSMDRKCATIDLESASDSVSRRNCRAIFRNSPALTWLINHSTEKAKLPNGQFIKLNKLAGMGSGLTFPIMALMAHLTVTRALTNRLRRPYRSVMKMVHCYGDDIILPTWGVSDAIEALERVGLHVNVDKSYYRGFFRESCGGDYFKGNEVNPVRCKLTGGNPEMISGSAFNVHGDLGVLAIERHCRELVKNGMLSTAEYYYQLLEKHLQRPLPRVSGESPALGRYTLSHLEYGTDATGAYVDIEAVFPSLVRVPFQRMDPYRYLGRSFSPRSAFRPFSTMEEVRLLFADEPKSEYGVVTVPRRLRLRPRKISSFRLMG